MLIYALVCSYQTFNISIFTLSYVYMQRLYGYTVFLTSEENRMVILLTTWPPCWGRSHRYLIYTGWCIPHCGQAKIEAGSQALVVPTELTRSMIICVF